MSRLDLDEFFKEAASDGWRRRTMAFGMFLSENVIQAGRRVVKRDFLLSGTTKMGKLFRLL
jgi:hypothetical protein